MLAKSIGYLTHNRRHWTKLSVMAGFVLLLGFAASACGLGPQASEPSPRTPTEPASGEQTSTMDLTDPGQALLDRGLLEGLSNIPQYALALNIQPDGLQYDGEVTLVYTNTTGVVLRDLVFRLLPNAGMTFGSGGLEVKNVQINDSPAVPQPDSDPSILRIPLADTLPPGQAVTVRMAFNGQVPAEFGGKETDAYGIFNFTQGVLSLASWYPILAVFENGGWRNDSITPIGDAVYSEMAYYMVDVTAPREWEVAATGVAVKTQENEDGTLIRRYVSGPVRDFYLTASPHFMRLSGEVDGVVVNAYGLPDSVEGNQAALDVAVNSIDIFNEQFGAYPYTELDVVEIPLRNAGGVEFPGIILIEAGRYAEPDEVAFITTVAHEVAHQWWYNVVGNDVFNEPWLDEALTSYASAVYWEEQYNEQAYQEVIAYWQDRVQGLREEGRDDRVTGSLAYFMENDPRRYGPVVYSKGALFFDAVRETIGDDAFFRALQIYYQDFRFRIAHGDDLLGVFEKVSGRDLDEIYQEWLYEP